MTTSLELPGVRLAGRGGLTDGVLRCTPSGVVWRKAGNSGGGASGAGGGPGTSVEVPAAEIASLTWTRTPRGGALVVCRKAVAAAAEGNGAAAAAAAPSTARVAPSPQFVGVSSSSLEALRALARSSWNAAEVQEVPSATRGASWGALELCGNGDLLFSTEGVNSASAANDGPSSAGTGGGLALRLPLADVSTVQLGKDEVTLELPADDTAGGGAADDALVGITFHVPRGATVAGLDADPAAAAALAAEEEAAAAKAKAAAAGADGENEDAAAAAAAAGPPPPATLLAAAARARCDPGAGSASGEPACSFPGVALLLPRGRFEVDMHAGFLQLSGQAHDYRIAYSSIRRVLVLPRPHSPHALVAVALDPPARKGATYYPFLLAQFPADEEVEEGGLELNLPEEVLAAKDAACGGKLPRVLTGTVPDVFARALRGLAGAKLARAGQGPSAFRAADGESAALRASLRADDGYLYPLDRAFFYAPKPPTLLQFDDVAGVEFVRRGGGVLAASQKTFDLAVRVRDGGGSGGSVEHVFRGIAKQEWAGLFEFLKAKGIRIDNLRDAAAGAGGGGRALDLGGSSRGGGGEDDDDDDSGDDEEFEAGSEDSESSDEDESSDSGGGGDDDDEDGGGSAKKSKKTKKKKRAKSSSPAGSDGATPGKAKKKKRKQAPKREAGAPKKPMAAYMHFSNAKRAEVLAANPGMAFGEVGRATGELWRALDAEGKRPWEEAAARDKERFAEEEAAWQAGKKEAGGGDGGAEEEEAGKEGE